MKDIQIKLADLSSDLLEIKTVPPIPAQAEYSQDDYGHRDGVYDYENQRWRVRNGQVIGYIVYGGKQRRPIAMWGGNY